MSLTSLKWSRSSTSTAADPGAAAGTGDRALGPRVPRGRVEQAGLGVDARHPLQVPHEDGALQHEQRRHRQQDQPRVDHHHGGDERADAQRGDLQEVLVGRADGLGRARRRARHGHGPRHQRRVDGEEHQQPGREHERAEPGGQAPRSQAITAEAATVASTNTAVVYACRCGGTRGPTERHHRCPCTTTAQSPAHPGDSSAAAAKNQTDAMLTCISPASVLRRTRSASRPSSVCSAATTTSSAAVRSAACGVEARRAAAAGRRPRAAPHSSRRRATP